MTGSLPWAVGPALARAVLLGVGSCAAGLALGLPELAVLGVPLVLAAVAALQPRPDAGHPLVRLAAPRVAAVGVRTDVEVQLSAGPAGADLVVVRLPSGSEPQGTVLGVAVPPAGRRLVVQVPLAAWGRLVLARPDAVGVAADGMRRLGPVPGQERSTLVLPSVPPALAGPLPPHPTSLVGRHRTRRPGAGSDLHAVDEFRPGDRLHRIDWRVTARRHGPDDADGDGDGDGRPVLLHVRRDTVDAEGEVVLLLDTRVDVTRDVASWATPAPAPGGAAGPGSSLDLAVSTAAGLASAHLRAGDRVSVLDLSRPTLWARPGTGRRHLARVRLVLAEMTASSERASIGARPPAVDAEDPLGEGPVAPPRRLLDRVPSRSLVVVLSPFLDRRSAWLAAALQRHGRSVLAVDTLPADLVPDRSTPAGKEALALVLAERQERLQLLRLEGVPVLPAGGDLVQPLGRLVRQRARR